MYGKYDHACMYVCMYVCARMHVCIYVCMYICIYVCMYVCMCVCVRMYAGMYVCVYVCMHLCICLMRANKQLKIILVQELSRDIFPEADGVATSTVWRDAMATVVGVGP